MRIFKYFSIQEWIKRLLKLMECKNLILIGSSHVSKESIELVRKTIEKEKPGIIAIELDKDRLAALMQKRKRSMFIKGVGIKGMIFALIGAWIERKIGKIVNVEPGSEMKTAVILAKKHNSKLALIDQSLSTTLKRFSKTITWKEKFNFIADIFLSIFAPTKQMKEIQIKKEDLSKVPSKETIEKILCYAKKRYPNFYNVLVHERNIVMADNLANLMMRFPKEKIVAVVGAGHENGIMAIIREKLYKEPKIM